MDALQRATRAKALIEDPLFKEAFDVLENAQISLFTNSVCSAEQLMEAHRMVLALRQLRGHLESVISDGQILEHRAGKKGQHRG